MQRKNDKLDRLRAEDRVLKHLDHTLAPTSNIILRRNRSKHTSTRQTNIANLSNYTLSNGELRLLSRGLSFCPSRDVNPVDLCQDMEQYLRRIKLKEYFQNDDTNSSPQTPLSREPSHKKSYWTPPSGRNQYIDSYVQTARGHLDRFILDNHHHSNKDNLTVNERKAIKTLRSNYDIAEVRSLVPEQPRPGVFYTFPKLHKLSKLIAEKMPSTSSGDPDQARTTISEDPVELCKAAKALKVSPPGRPIVSGIGTMTEFISGYVDNLLQPLLPRIPSFIKDTTHFLQTLQDIENLTENTLLVTMDVSSLYSNIPHVEGVQACEDFLRKCGFEENFLRDICSIIRFILLHNHFEFNSRHFLQIQGTAMGTKMAPSYANVFMDALEQKLLSGYHLKPDHYCRYIDDIFFIWTHGVDSLHDFNRQIGKLINHFLRSDYPLKVIKKATIKASKVDRNKLLTYSSKTPHQRIPMVFEFNYKLTKLSRPLVKDFKYLRLDPSIRDLFSDPPLSARRQPPNLRSLLTSSRLPQPPASHGNRTCNKRRCQVCKHIITDVPFIPPGTTTKIRPPPLTCDSSNVVYLLVCTRCDREEEYPREQEGKQQRPPLQQVPTDRQNLLPQQRYPCQQNSRLPQQECPPQQGYPPQTGYPPQHVPDIPMVNRDVQTPAKDYLVFATFVTIFCCWPLGIVAIIQAFKVRTLNSLGDYTSAQRASHRAKNWSIGTLICGLALPTIAVMYYGLFRVAVFAVSNAFFTPVTVAPTTTRRPWQLQ
ncbi:Proline-rich transmembrane protein 1 [Holothuria leucospilota]|uniref:Proline-rich transmembrane protein 1 n=1 Tax=Holothuria leucospilota TaxID=206669 RepID=A0A9Q1GZK9_HOLLE|nr:Proline-rich transmembrane protein 1 [Holothuria leucospilota]